MIIPTVFTASEVMFMLHYNIFKFGIFLNKDNIGFQMIKQKLAFLGYLCQLIQIWILISNSAVAQSDEEWYICASSVYVYHSNLKHLKNWLVYIVKSSDPRWNLVEPHIGHYENSKFLFQPTAFLRFFYIFFSFLIVDTTCFDRVQEKSWKL